MKHHTTFKNILCLILLLSAAAPSVISCGVTMLPYQPTDSSSSVIDTESETVDDGSVRDDVPILDFGGAEFRTIQQTPGKYGFYTESENSDQVNDIIYKRIRNVEERLHINVVETQCMDFGDVSEKLHQSVLSGTDDYELVMNQIFKSGSDAIAGYLYDWNKIPYINLSQPWYTKSIQDASVGERLYMIESDLSMSYMNQTWFILYNKTITDSENVEDLYQVVNNGRWTVDYLYQLASDLYRDVNGNSKADEGDVYGLATSITDDCMIAAVYYAMDGRMVTLSDDSTSVTHVIEEEQNINVLTKVAELLFEMPNVYNGLKVGSTERIPRFVSGEFVFVTSQVSVLINEELRNFDDHYGVLPLPKYDEALDEYYTLVDGGADILTIPATAKNLELIGAAVEVMSAYSYNYVVPTYMDIGLEQKGTRDNESIQMLRQILDSRVIDFGYLYDTGDGWCMKLEKILEKKDSISSKITKYKRSTDRYYTNLLEQFHSNIE